MSWLSWIALLHRFHLGPRYVAPGQPDPPWMLRDAEHRRILAEMAREALATSPGMRVRLRVFACRLRFAARLGGPAPCRPPRPCESEMA